MAYDDFSLLSVRTERGICRATIDNPPINLFDVPLMLELDRLGREVEADDDVRVVVLASANPTFFIAHADVNAILALPREADADPSRDDSAPAALGFFHAMVDRFRTMPKATIAVIEGIARGGGCELVASFDIRIAASGRAVFGQPEVLLGLIPGGSGTQRWPRLVGRNRALEVVLGGADVDADTADRWGFVNRSLPPDQIVPFVDSLATRIASLPAVALTEAKAAVNDAEPDPVPGLRAEARAFARTLTDGEAIRRMEEFLARGGQTAELEARPLPLAGGWV
jgi:enoyl-CoA hydratase/carnithine racemase